MKSASEIHKVAENTGAGGFDAPLQPFSGERAAEASIIPCYESNIGKLRTWRFYHFGTSVTA
jgi:hypothetical protein